MRTTSVSINGQIVSEKSQACAGRDGDYNGEDFLPTHRRKTTYDVERTKNEAVVQTRDTRGNRNRRCRADRRRVNSRADSVTRETPFGGRGLQERPGAQGNSRGRFPGDDGDHGGCPSIRLLGLSRWGRHG